MELELWHYAALIIAGVLGGIINVMAGGGSILTVPLMILLGVPGPVANGTNRIAILAQNLTAAVTFHHNGLTQWRLGLTLTGCAIPGAVLGAWVGSGLRGELFNTVLAAVMLAVLVLMQTGRSANTTSPDQPRNLIAGHVLMMFAGFWGGFIQIGMGFILLPIMHKVMGLSLVTVNVLKVFIASGYTAIALAIFMLNSEILWLVGGVLAIGNTLGGYLGAKLTIKKGDALIRHFVTIAILVLVVRLLFF
ncbi:MAG: sulfite exporter TauE/SafE family protein [Alphaproteobacteria bacterium]|nr:sulfite exporter TauE/SafE family protein [Alphaproteobacteria bacterium]